MRTQIIAFQAHAFIFPTFSTDRQKQKRPRKPYASGVFRSVEVAGFEPAAFWSRTGQRLPVKSDRDFIIFLVLEVLER